jgi:hypothetical protein
MISAFFLTLLVGLLVGIGSPDPSRTTTKVLFLGNSYTAANNLPDLVVNLAASGGHTVIEARNTPGGNTLGAPQSGGWPHMSNPTSLSLITSDHWDFVVLQEQSYLPTIPHTRDQYMKPGAQSLDASIKAADPDTRTVLYETWGRRDGGKFCWSAYCSPDFADFDAMQDSLTSAYEEVGELISATVAPVGEAWRIARHDDPAIVLHGSDGAHPNLAGSYLAACVFHAIIFDESPVGLSFISTLDAGEAAFLQGCAARAIWEPTCGFSTYGSGAANVLALRGSGDTSLGGTVLLTTPRLPVGASGAWIVGCFAPLDTPLFGGTLLVDLACIAVPVTFIGALVGWPVTLPADPSFAGADLYFQALCPDPSLPGGFALSRGLALEICP